MDKILRNIVGKSILIWLLGWISLCLIEIWVWRTTGFPPLYKVLLLTVLVYSVAGILLGLIFGLAASLIQRSLHFREGQDRIIYFSMAACICCILFLYSLTFLLRPKPYLTGPVLILGSLLLFSSALVSIGALPFFFRRMERRGDLGISYISLLPCLWIFTAIKLNESKELLPPVVQITTPYRTLIFIFSLILFYFLVFFLLSLCRRAYIRWKGVAFFKPVITVLLCALILLSFVLLRRDKYPERKNGVSNVPSYAPNIVLITMDTVRTDHLSCYGYGKTTTPNLDTFAREGVLFRNAYATSSWTLPSHASMFTGQYPSVHGADHRSGTIPGGEKKAGLKEIMLRNFSRLSDEKKTLAEFLSERGYRTAGVVGGIFCASLFGLDQGFDYYDDEIPFFNIRFFLIYQVIDLFISAEDFFTQYGYMGKRIASHLNESAFAWLDKHQGQPFFLFINYMDAHTPYLPPPPFEESFGRIEKACIMGKSAQGTKSFVAAQTNLINSVLNGSHRLTSDEKELLLALYDGGILCIDYHLGLLFDKLKALKAYDKTLIIITSDHGEAFGEHNQMDHGLTLYEEVLRVPLIIKYPAFYPRRGVIEKRVSLVDLMPTVLSFLNVPVPEGIDGAAIGHSDHPLIGELILGIAQKYHKGSGDLRTVYQENYKFIWSSSGSHELYNLGEDPGEENNLLETFPHKVQAMEKMLNQWLTTNNLLDLKKETVTIDKSTEEKLRALGYVR